MAIPLQTIVPIDNASNPIGYDSKILLLGSCFVENIGNKLEYFKFQATQNPFGILFHPIALGTLIRRALEKEHYEVPETFEREGIYYCFDAHSDLRASSKKELLENLNHALVQTEDEIKRASHIVITLGTAWVYEHLATNAIVSNCHKVPQSEFSKKLLSAEQIQSSLESMIAKITEVNPEVQFLLTVSPVRHLKDGFMENQRSKANLITAIHNILSFRAQSGNLSYFPAYEIMMDELRDYRFYDKDMVHPNTLAVDYIWEKFKLSWIDSGSYELMDEVDKTQKALLHRPFNPDSEANTKFQQSLKTKIAYLQERLPFVKFEQ